MREKLLHFSRCFQNSSFQSHSRRTLIFLQNFVQAEASREPRPGGKPNPNYLILCWAWQDARESRSLKSCPRGIHPHHLLVSTREEEMLAWWNLSWSIPPAHPRVAGSRGMGRGHGEAPGGAAAEGQPHPLHWPGRDAAGRDFQQLSEPAKQTRAKSSRVM